MGNTLTSDENTERLHIAVSKGNLTEVKHYLQKGADVEKLIWVEELDDSSAIGNPTEAETPDKAAGDEKEPSSTLHAHKKTVHINALHRAAMRRNNVEVLRTIAEKISNIDQQDSEGNSALHYAAVFPNNQEALKLLIDLKPNVNVQNAVGETVLFSSIKNGGDMQTIELLLKAGADPNIPDRDGSTSLHVCASLRGIDPLIPGVLLRCGGNPNLKNLQAGQTPLHVAAVTANKAVLLLLQYKAKVRLQDNAGRYPSDVAATEDIRRILVGEERELIESTSGASLLRFCTACNHVIKEPGQSNLMESSPRWYLEQYKRLSGTGGCGQIILPSGEEIVVPADTIPVESSVKITLKTVGNKEDAEIDYEDFDFKLDLSIPVPGIRGRQELYDMLPVFTSLRLGGSTTWRCTRDVIWNPRGYGVLNLSLNAKSLKGKKHFQSQKKLNDPNEEVYEIPATKRNEMENDLLSFQQTEAKTSDRNTDQANVADAMLRSPEYIYDISDASEMEHLEPDKTKNNNREQEIPVRKTNDRIDHYAVDGNFCARHVVVVNEHEAESYSSSEEENSSDEERSDTEVNRSQGHGNNEGISALEVDADTYVQDDEMYQELYEYVHSNDRIQHPIDNELSTITEEGPYSSGQRTKCVLPEYASRSSDDTQELRNSADNFQQSDYFVNDKTGDTVTMRDERNSTYSLDSGFVGNDDTEFEKQEGTDNMLSNV